MNNTQTDMRIITYTEHQREKAEKKLLSAFDNSVGYNCSMCSHFHVNIRRDLEKGFEGLCCADRDKHVTVDALDHVICRDFDFVGSGAHQMRVIALFNYRKSLRKLTDKNTAIDQGGEV